MRQVTILIAAALTLAVSPVLAQTQVSPSESTIEECQPGLGYLPSIRRDQIEAIDDSYRISIWPVCVNHPDPGLRMAGNAGGLHSTIAENETLSSALAEERYDADDVVGVRFGNGPSVILYVHRAN